MALESKSESTLDRLTDLIIGAAIEVHRHTGPLTPDSAVEKWAVK